MLNTRTPGYRSQYAITSASIDSVTSKTARALLRSARGLPIPVAFTTTSTFCRSNVLIWRIWTVFGSPSAPSITSACSRSRTKSTSLACGSFASASASERPMYPVAPRMAIFIAPPIHPRDERSCCSDTHPDRETASCPQADATPSCLLLFF